MLGNRDLEIDWPELSNEHGDPILWFGAWLVGDEGVEGDWFHSGRGAARTTHAVPSDATGVRLRRWPNEGLAPEYADPDPDTGRIGRRVGCAVRTRTTVQPAPRGSFLI